MIEKIVSGGQTGADQAALDVAIGLGIPHSGWIPKGRKTEDGPLPKKYQMQEMPTASYEKRTQQNIVESHGTLLISHGKLTGGSALTRRLAKIHKRPFLHIDLNKTGAFLAAAKIIIWLHQYEITILNVADRLRVTAQLIDAIKGHHLWAESYDRELKEIFALQDEITVKILSALDVKLLLGTDEAAPYFGRGTKNLQAYLKTSEALQYFERGTPDDYALARKLSEEAIATDPEYPTPYFILAFTHILDVMLGTSKSPRESIGKAFKLAQKVLAMDESDPRAHRILANVYRVQGKHEKAIAESERAVFLNPNSEKGYMNLATSLIQVGRSPEAIPLLKKSMRLSPLSQTHASMCLFRLGRAYRTMGQYEDALSALKKAANIRPDMWAIQVELAATYVHLGREAEARAAADEVRRIVPKFSLERFAKRIQTKDQAEKKRYIDALREAGLK